MSGFTTFLDVNSILASTFIRHVELYDTLPSTNDQAIKLASAAELNTPALVAARLQTSGRGRGKNTWWSADGALTFSVILDTLNLGLTQRDWPRLSLATAVAVCDAVPAHSRIKWPNDVLLDGRKVCGILIESPARIPPAKSRLIIGVGINVNNTWRDAPRGEGLGGIALCDATGDTHDLECVLQQFLNALELRLKQLVANESSLSKSWQQLCWLTGKDVVADNGTRLINGCCLGISDDGALLVKTPLTTEAIYSGSIHVES
jgi:BirA family biotin operon repressor/biotin-[acetyl-CoA-carboxylase] ligase